MGRGYRFLDGHGPTLRPAVLERLWIQKGHGRNPCIFDAE
jgi:hypothetical protein